MRRGMCSLALQVQYSFSRDSLAENLYIFRERQGHLCKIIWHDGVVLLLYAKRLKCRKYTVDGLLCITCAACGAQRMGIGAFAVF